jgi:hypothetical protein
MENDEKIFELITRNTKSSCGTPDFNYGIPTLYVSIHIPL